MATDCRVDDHAFLVEVLLIERVCELYEFGRVLRKMLAKLPKVGVLNALGVRIEVRVQVQVQETLHYFANGSKDTRWAWFSYVTCDYFNNVRHDLLRGCLLLKL